MLKDSELKRIRSAKNAEDCFGFIRGLSGQISGILFVVARALAEWSARFSGDEKKEKEWKKFCKQACTLFPNVFPTMSRFKVLFNVGLGNLPDSVLDVGFNLSRADALLVEGVSRVSSGAVGKTDFFQAIRKSIITGDRSHLAKAIGSEVKPPRSTKSIIAEVMKVTSKYKSIYFIDENGCTCRLKKGSEQYKQLLEIIFKS